MGIVLWEGGEARDGEMRERLVIQLNVRRLFGAIIHVCHQHS